MRCRARRPTLGRKLGQFGGSRSNKSFDTDTLLQGAASRAGEYTSRGALQQRAGQLRR